MTDSDRKITEGLAEDYAHPQTESVATNSASDDLLREYIHMQVAIAEVMAESRMAWVDRLALSDAMRTNTNEYQGMCSEQRHLFGIGLGATLPERKPQDSL